VSVLNPRTSADFSPFLLPPFPPLPPPVLGSCLYFPKIAAIEKTDDKKKDGGADVAAAPHAVTWGSPPSPPPLFLPFFFLVTASTHTTIGWIGQLVNGGTPRWSRTER